MAPLTRMRVPQELMDEIIGTLDLSQEYDPQIAEALKSCALVAHSFVRHSQARLFAKISVRDYDRHTSRRNEALSSSPHISSIMLSQKLSALLSRSPHLATYIRTLDLCYNATTTEANFMPQILSAVTALTGLTLTDHFCGYFPSDLSTRGAFSLSSLQSVELCRYQFRNALELESLLSKAKCLKELTLRAIDFDDLDPIDIEAVLSREINSTSAVKLQSLSLVSLNSYVVHAMLDSFTTVDIRHLKTLSIRNGPAVAFLRANAHSIQTLNLENQHANISFDSDVLDPRMMEGGTHLTYIHLELKEIFSLLLLVPTLGDLENLTALKTMRITLGCCIDADDLSVHDEWEQLDALLHPLPSAVQVEIYADLSSFAIPIGVDAVKRRLPLLSNRGTLQVGHSSHCEA
ncbi:hypothetical protein B0H12DRAFT_1330521 [Mycena haematopus]|nr:hypothetical protein B0H12DRAFT_1330521 [Mycena haematopus]